MSRLSAYDPPRMSTRRATLVVMLTLVMLNIPLIAAPIASAASTEFAPTDDTYGDARKPDRVRGARSFLRVDSSPVRISYLRFEAQGVGTPVSASLQINVETSGDDIELYAVSDTSWDETTLTFNNAPPLGALMGTVTGVQGGLSYYFDVSSYITGDGVYAFAMKTTDHTAIRIGAKEGGNGAILHIPAPVSPSQFVVTRSGSIYTAASATTSSSYTGTLKSAVESAVAELDAFGGGTITFGADTFDLGSDHFEFDDISNIVFEGQGTSATLITNNTSSSADTEPFDIVTADSLTLRDFTVAANGAVRSTSDALDFDNGSNIVIERVAITASRGRGIVFDGKGTGWSADNNTITDCVITGVPGDGIELLASSSNTITGCTITDTGGHGIQLNKSSGSADQPNKKSNGNLVSGNTIDNSGQDGININSSDQNRIINNVVTNSADDTANKDGIRVSSNSGITCDDNEIDGNTSTDNQVVKTQRYGVNISSANCNATVLGNNSLTGNSVADINDLGTGTVYNLPPDVEPPSVPTGVAAVALSHFQVDVSWSASTDNVGVTAYTVYRDGAPLTTVDGSTLSFLDTTVAPEMTYGYTVEAFDAAGNPSGQSSPDAQVTTPPAPSGGTSTFNPTDDAYVNSSRPTRNYGSSSSIRIDGSPEKNAYFKFDVGGLTGTVSSATVRIYAATGSSVGFDLSEVSDTTWTEAAITFDTAPAIGPALGSSGSFSGGIYIEFDVTSYVSGNGAVSFAITTPHTTAIRFDSSEGTNQPELVIIQSP